jgi:hypothetical protein
VWANSPWSSSYEDFWDTTLAIRVRGSELSLDFRHWVNDGLMAFFFFVAGVEIRRQFDMGELREHRRLATPVVAALGGMVAPALIYLAFNAGESSVRGWGIAMGTDTAFALGVLALVGERWAPGVKTFLLTLVIVDDIVALTVVALAYTEDVSSEALLVALALFGVVLIMRRVGVRNGVPYFLVGTGLWIAMIASGVHATIAGIAFDIFTMHLNGGGHERNLTNSPGVQDFGPEWSPDGRRIAFTADSSEAQSSSSGCQSGPASKARLLVRFTGLLPSARIVKISAFPSVPGVTSRKLEKAISLPSGDQAGRKSERSWKVSLVWSPPSARIV